MISKIHSTTIVVSNQEAALEFYTKTLGWEKAMDAPMGPGLRWLTVVPPGSATQLVLSDPAWHGGQKEGSKVGGETGISLTAENIDETYATLTARGVKFKKPIEVMPWGKKGGWFSDPDGNEYFLAEE